MRRQVKEMNSFVLSYLVSRQTKSFICAILLLSAAAAAQSAGPAFPDPGKTSMSRDDQRKLGLQAASQVYQQMPLLPDSSPETQYIRQLGKKLVATIPQQYSWPFEFHVVAQKEINAFALPGGPMFVNIGTITAAANEAQLAGVMAHEMSHVYMQHSAKQASKAEKTSLISEIAGVALGATAGGMAGGLVGELGQMGIQFGSQGMMMKFSRGDESQADAVGAMIMYKAGYNPQAMADFFKTLETEGGKLPPQWLSDHPNPGNREQAIQKEIANWPPVTYSGDSASFKQVNQHAKGVRAYTAAEIDQGAKSGTWAGLNKKNGANFTGDVPGGGSPTRDSASASSTSKLRAAALQKALPSERMVPAEIGPVKMQRPENWNVSLPQQQGQFVTVAPQAGVTEQGVGYGVLLNGLAASQVQRNSIDDATNRIVQSMQQSSHLQVMNSSQRITVGGIEGRSVVLRSSSPFADSGGKPEQERDWLVTVPQRDGSLIFMIFIAPEPDFGRFQPAYEAMLKSMQFR
jgi:Zn-dependent protease with chaperone function